MDKQEMTQKVSQFISTGTMTDLNEMSELAMLITEAKANAYERFKKTQYMQEAYRIAQYIEMKKSGDKISEMRADKESKLKAMEKYDYTEYDVDYKMYSDLLQRLIERKIEVQTINKTQKYVDEGF
jgi:hypothetical protein